ncbi:MAG: acetyltransferase domain protein [Nevskia sp.]|nr:acetyltransferase domain protein [Nevskia sp.]
MDRNAPKTYQLSAATAVDVADILRLIRALAEYEKLSDQVVATEAALQEALFGATPRVEALVARSASRVVGFALYFQNYSTFRARSGVYLEDLFVEPEYRGSGIGQALLRKLAGIAVARGCERFEWAVLDWNVPAIEFYQSLGARPLDDWTVYRLGGDALQALAAQA